MNGIFLFASFRQVFLKEVSIMMETIAKSQWKDYLDDLSKAIKDVPVEIEVKALGIFDKKGGGVAASAGCFI